MFRAKQAVPKLTSSTSRSCVFMVSSSRGFSAYNSFLSSFCFLHDRKVGRLGKDVHDSSGDDCSEGDQAKNGCWVVSHRKALSTYVMNLSGFVTKRKPPARLFRLFCSWGGLLPSSRGIRSQSLWGQFLYGVATRQHSQLLAEKPCLWRVFYVRN